MTSAAPARRRLLSFRHETVESIFGYAYAILMGNVLVAAFNAPLVVLLFSASAPLAVWPVLLVASLTLAPSIAGLFSVFRSMKEEGAARPFSAFWAGYRRSLGKALAIGVATGLVVFVALTDATALSGTVWALLAGPTLVVLSLVAVAAALLALAGVVLFPGVTLGAVLKASLYLAVRRWYFSVMALVLCGVIGAAVLLQPLIGAAFVPALLLFPVWGNAHFAFTRVVEQSR